MILKTLGSPTEESWPGAAGPMMWLGARCGALSLHLLSHTPGVLGLPPRA